MVPRSGSSILPLPILPRRRPPDRHPQPPSRRRASSLDILLAVVVTRIVICPARLPRRLTARCSDVRSPLMSPVRKYPLPLPLRPASTLAPPARFHNLPEILDNCRWMGRVGRLDVQDFILEFWEARFAIHPDFQPKMDPQPTAV